MRRRINQDVQPVASDNEPQDEHVPSSNDQSTVASFFRFINVNTPLLTNYEEKQIAESLLNHAQESSLTFDEAQTFAMNKARDIGTDQYTIK